ncbi:enoyl-CoA hydratase/isomerase family protein [Ferrovibrio sp.]|uniref:enoyl-CoA hydratase/isomerase family protein n=1 Tax=Ferrovibrio sp. TaxID=1917215 RepID=UPI003D0DE7CD
MPFAVYERQGPVGLVTLNRPERLNAIGQTLLADFAAVLRQAQGDEEIGAIVLTGAGRAFCSGDDLKEYADQTASDDAIAAHVAAIQRITHLLMAGPRPVICAAHGYAVGGGFEWMLNCDLVVASEDLKAFFPEMELGQFVTGGITHLLPRALGHQRSMELLLLGEVQSALRLEQLGLVNFVVPSDRLMTRAMEVATTVAARSRFAVGRLKETVNLHLGSELWRAIELEQAATMDAFHHADTAERIRGTLRGKWGAA